MLTVLVAEEKLQQFRDYAALQGISMGAIVNQLIDRLLSGESIETSQLVSIDIPKSIQIQNDSSIADLNKSIEKIGATSIDNYHKTIEMTSAESIENHREYIEEVVAISIDNNNKAIEIRIATSIDNNNNSLEKIIGASIDNYAKTLPPTLSLQDIDRLIGSTTSSITKANNEVIAELKNIIGHQGTEIASLSKMVSELIAVDIQSPTTKAFQPLSSNSLSWSDFCEMISEPLPTDRNKASGDKMTVVASNKGLSGWKYNGNSKKFTHQPN